MYKNQFNTGCYSPVCGAGVCLASVFYRPWLIISYTETSDTTHRVTSRDQTRVVMHCTRLHLTLAEEPDITKELGNNVFLSLHCKMGHTFPWWSVTVWTNARLKCIRDAQLRRHTLTAANHSTASSRKLIPITAGVA